ncbi:hypothetical protein EGW08_022788 [Elysia chlorotica]|uniref:Uncharacterized protein n=1 Tax=Elysia chlorotica TaxID=188477 RepID=A0A433SKA5_ELYCH|nr:hypothetical protein EGW08_022788 [Elysia chlorotica]
MCSLIGRLRLVLDQLTKQDGLGCSCSHEVQQLLTVEDVPDVIKEPYIYSGYRLLNKPWSYYVKSIFRLHNESVNVWTHGLGFFVVLFSMACYLDQLDMQKDCHASTILVFGLCCLCNLAASSAAHLFHSRSRWDHFAFFLLDYMGVTFYAFGSGVNSMFICSSKAFHELFSGWFLPVNVLLSWFAFYACCVAKIKLAHNNTHRKVVMIAGVLCQAVVVSLPAVSRYVDCLQDPTCDIRHLNHLTVVFALLILCAISFAGHMPESLWPGHFDVLGHGHQWFHVAVVLAMLAQVWVIDIEVNVTQRARQLEQPGQGELLAYLALLVLVETATFVYYMRQVVFRRLSRDIPRQLVSQSIKKKFSVLPGSACKASSDSKNYSETTTCLRNGEKIVENNETSTMTETHKKCL